MTDRVQDFPGMLRTALGQRVADDATTFVDMLAPDAVMAFPFAPPGLPRQLEGRAAVAEHLRRLGRLIAFDSIGPATVVSATDDVVVIAFEARGRGLATGAAYEQRYLSVIETRGGRIVRYLDYWDPLAVVRALASDAVVDTLDLGTIYHG